MPPSIFASWLAMVRSSWPRASTRTPRASFRWRSMMQRRSGCRHGFPAPLKMELGEGGDPWNSIYCSIFLFMGKTGKMGMGGPPTPSPLSGTGDGMEQNKLRNGWEPRFVLRFCFLVTGAGFEDGPVGFKAKKNTPTICLGGPQETTHPNCNHVFVIFPKETKPSKRNADRKPS